MKRRTLLSLACSSITVGLAGCLSDDEDSPADDTDDGGEDTDTGAEDDGDDAIDGNEENGEQSDDQNGDPIDDEDENGTGDELVVTDSFSAVSQGGFIAIDEAVDSRAQAQTAGFSMPASDEGDDPIRIEADVFEDGTWESTDIQFPPLSAQGFEAAVSLPEGLDGKLTEGRMTINGQLRIDIDDGSDEPAAFSFEIHATTGQSGLLAGEANFATRPRTGTAVDNEFTITEQTGNFLIDSALGLPAEESGTNWFEVDLELLGE